MAATRKRTNSRHVADTVMGKEIVDGLHDADLDIIVAAVAYRKKVMFRPGAKVRLVGTRNAEIDGKIGTVIKVNTKRITVGLGTKGDWGYDEGEYNVPAAMLEIVTVGA